MLTVAAALPADAGAMHPNLVRLVRSWTTLPRRNDIVRGWGS